MGLTPQFPLFPGLWLVEQFPRILSVDKPRIEMSTNLVDQFIYETPKLNWCLVICQFLASESLSCFRGSADKPLMGLSSDLVDGLIMGLPKPGKNLVAVIWLYMPYAPYPDWVTIIYKRSSRIQIGNVSAHVTFKFDKWPWKTTEHLFHAPRSYVCHFITIYDFKLGLSSGNAQIGAKSSIFRPVWT